MREHIDNCIQKMDRYFRETNPAFTERERFFSRAIKLNEEVGELCEAVLVEYDANQRKKDKDVDLDSELADIIICTLLLGTGREKNIWEEVNKKLDKQMKRFNLE